MDFKISFYVLMIILVLKNKKKKIFNSEDINNEIGDKHLYIAAKTNDNKKIAKKISGAKTNSNTITAFNFENGNMTVPDIIYDLIIKSSLSIKENNVYLTFKSKEEIELFRKWLKISAINKSIYINKKCFVNMYIKKLENSIKLKKLPKSKGNKVPKSKVGSTGIASKIYFLETEEDIEVLSADKIFFSFEEIYNNDYSINYDNLWSKLKKTVFIKKSIEIYGYNNVKKDFYSFPL